MFDEGLDLFHMALKDKAGTESWILLKGLGKSDILFSNY